jgi:hypothetical protein
LVRKKLHAPRHERIDVRSVAAAAGLAHELQQRARDLLAAVRLLLDRREVRAKIAELFDRIELEIAHALEQRFRASRDRRERIVELMRHPRREAPRRRQALGEQHLTLEPLRARHVLDEHHGMRRRLTGRRQRGGRETEDAQAPRERHLLLQGPYGAGVQRVAHAGLHGVRVGLGKQRAKRAPARRAVAEDLDARGIGPHDGKGSVEDEHAEGQRLEHHLHEALLHVQLTRALLHARLQLAVEPRVVERDRRLIGERDQQLLLPRRERVNVTSQREDGADRAVAEPQRCRQHGAEPARLRQLGIAHAHVVPEVGALDGTLLRDRDAADPFADAQPHAWHECVGQIEARHQPELARDRVQHEQAARFHAEHGSRLGEDHADRLVDVEARRHRAPGAEERAGLARAAHAVLEELRVVDGERGLLAETLEHALMMGGERVRARRERRDHTEQSLAAHHRHAEHRPDTFPLVHVAPRRSPILPNVVDENRLARLRAAPDDALAHRELERAPLAALDSVRGGLHQSASVRAQQGDPAARRADERRDGAADPIEHRGEIEACGNEPVRRVQRGQLVRAPPALVEQLERGAELAREIVRQA